MALLKQEPHVMVDVEFPRVGIMQVIDTKRPVTKLRVYVDIEDMLGNGEVVAEAVTDSLIELIMCVRKLGNPRNFNKTEEYNAVIYKLREYMDK